MIRIQSLLNAPPSSGLLPDFSSISAPPTPAYTVRSYQSTPTPTPTPRPVSHRMETETGARSKAKKDGTLFVKGPTIGKANFPPFELTDDLEDLTDTEKAELAAQHKRFKVRPHSETGDGYIGEYVKYVPYRSEKDNSLKEAGRDGFHVFGYVFTHRGEDWLVLWDYQVGLVRMTPFYKALGHGKVVPRNSIVATPGLMEVAHSPTGGNILAQGFWLPYNCARAVCTTYCWNIRGALTPVFGPSFVNDCIEPGRPGYEQYRINLKLIEEARRDMKGWKDIATTLSHVPLRGKTHTKNTASTSGQAPRSAPTPAPKRTRAGKNTKMATPAMTDDSDGDYVDSEYQDSPPVSPRTTTAATWNTVNRPTPSGSDMPGFRHQGIVSPTTATNIRDTPQSLTSLHDTGNNAARRPRSETSILISEQGNSDADSDMDTNEWPGYATPVRQPSPPPRPKTPAFMKRDLPLPWDVEDEDYDSDSVKERFRQARIQAVARRGRGKQPVSLPTARGASEEPVGSIEEPIDSDDEPVSLPTHRGRGKQPVSRKRTRSLSPDTCTKDGASDDDNEDGVIGQAIFKKARVGFPGPGKYRSKEYNAARALMYMASGGTSATWRGWEEGEVVDEGEVAVEGEMADEGEGEEATE